ncbi:hypothetical protein BJ875DRAFT_67515 [Amylocarpus encephaloides]|uniref:RRM domain-containing protein n=1 Tax=Amylocarpus encephaloides TaxID=45428 RepID=A0A9P7YF62_9HELO|nr:hypothetical protein BJ875DRAFT_67515 [Amylocarpus encephaloides]
MAFRAKDSDATIIADSQCTRLHITPLNPDLLPAILPPSILPNARNISYHSIETFPEKAYGFIELPAMDAEKVKKRLNGAILKGSKVRIEKARPQKEAVANDGGAPEKSKKQTKASRKRKRTDDTIIGAEIEDRFVKRGWTTPPAPGKLKENNKDKRKIKSKYTSNSECLFNTVIPPNVASKSKALDKPDKAERKKAKAGKDAVVHEFSKTTKYATFLRSTTSGNKKVSEGFIEDKGWVDEDGNVVEGVVSKLRKPPKTKKVSKPELPAAIEKQDSENSESESSANDSSSDEEEPAAISKATTDGAAPPAVEERSDDTSEEKSSPEGSSSEEESEYSSAVEMISKTVALAPSNDTETSSSGSSSSDSESDLESLEDEDTTPVQKEATSPHPLSRPQSSSGAPVNLSIKIPEPEITLTPVSATVHPLEALYKHPKLGQESVPKSAVPSFSFFGADGDVDEDEEMEEAQDKVPLTPFTQRDFEYRGLRSAAPTPDTAHANKRFMWPSSRDDDEDEDEVASCSPIRHQKFKNNEKSKPKGNGKEKSNEGEKEESDFQKWFYEHRGDTNRAWKKRRKIAGKEKRHRDNKKGGERVA